MGWWGGEWVEGSMCEDAPCCGCCGPGSDDPAWSPYGQEEDMYGFDEDESDWYADQMMRKIRCVSHEM